MNDIKREIYFNVWTKIYFLIFLGISYFILMEYEYECGYITKNLDGLFLICSMIFLFRTPFTIFRDVPCEKIRGDPNRICHTHRMLHPHT